MVGGSLIVAVCLLVLGYTAEIVGAFVADPETVSTPFDSHTESHTVSHTVTIGQIMHHWACCTQYLRRRFCDQRRLVGRGTFGME